MNVSLRWLEAMLGMALDPDDVARRLAMLGAPVEAVEQVGAALGDVVVALVEAVERHPNADRLWRCRVNDGTAVRDVVCGAPQVVAGVKYAYAPVGATLPGGLKLSARKIRGVTSHGMLCSPSELGLGTDHEGILAVETDAVPGTPLVDAVPVSDVRLDLDVTPNRPDLLGHRGVARELGAAYGAPVKLPRIPGAPEDVGAPRRAAARGRVDGVDVVIEDVEGCPRYIAAVIRGVTVGPSPAWLEARLRAIDARPINNVVDATNYLLYELNQPLHAFDLARLGGPAIVVRRAQPGERLTTLDGEVRALEPAMTMICDAQRPTAVGGVMGGVDSEVTERTTDVLLECAYFDPKRIRATRQALKMSTEASYRFERGTDIQAMPEVVRRAVALIRAVAGGAEREAAVDVYPRPVAPRAVFLRPERVARLLGTEVPRDEVERLLVGIGFAVAPKDGRMHVQVPGWRPDVTREVDLIEEVARLRGYDAFPVALAPFRPGTVPDDPVEPLKATLRRAFTARGLHEARSVSLRARAGDGAQAVLNPLSAEEAWLRTDLLPGLVASAERNWAARVRDIRLFEIGTVFHAAGAGERPHEALRIAGVVSGARVPTHWSGAGKAPEYDLWDVKAMFEEAARLAGPDAAVVPVTDDGEGWLLRDAAGVRRGWAGALAADRPAWAAPLYGFELDIEVRERAPRRLVALPGTPPLERDLALLVPTGVTAAAVEAAIRETAGALLAEAAVFDEYRGAAVGGGGERSVAWRLVFRAPDRTLRDEEADRVVERILKRLEERFDVRRR